MWIKAITSHLLIALFAVINIFFLLRAPVVTLSTREIAFLVTFYKVQSSRHTKTWNLFGAW